MKRKMKKRGFMKNIFGVELSSLFILSLVVLNISLLILNIFIFNLDVLLFIGILMVLDILLLFFKKLYINYSFSKQKKELEDGLVDELLRLTSLPKSNDLKLILAKLESSKNQIISKEFKEINLKIKKGHNPKDVFNLLKEKYNSDVLNRFLDLIILNTTTGTVSVSDYKNIASNFLKTKLLLDERNTLLLTQKYTIIIAGGILVPGILGVVISLVKKLGTSLSLEAIGISNSLSLYLISYWCSIIYIIEYVIISSFYISLIEQNSKKTVVYLSFLLPASFLIFFAGRFIV